MINKTYGSIVRSISLEVKVFNAYKDNGFYTATGIVDTGASDVCISKNIAEAIAVEGEGSIEMKTANGPSESSSCTIKLEMDDYTFNYMDAVILPNLNDDTVLIGLGLLNLGDTYIKTSSGKTEFCFDKTSQTF